MKRLLALLLTVAMLLPLCALADTYGVLNTEISTRTGPGTNYTEPGTFLSAGDVVTVRSRVWDDRNEIWWVQVEFWDNGKKLRAYTGSWRMSVDLNQLRIEMPLCYCTVACDASAYTAPYDDGQSGRWSDTVPGGTQVTLYEIDGDYALIECWNSRRQVMWRVWVRTSDLDCGYLYGSGTFYVSQSDTGSSSNSGYNNGYTGSTGSIGSIGSVSYSTMYASYLPYIPAEGITPECRNTDSIKWVQQCLRRLGYGNLAVDGDWGSQTSTAVRQFKADYGYSTLTVNLTREIVCAMLDAYCQRGQPLEYLGHFVP